MENRLVAIRREQAWGTWVAQSVKHPALAQVMISQLLSSSPTSGTVLTARILEPASDSVSPSLSARHLLACSLSKVNKHSKKNFNKDFFKVTKTEEFITSKKY